MRIMVGTAQLKRLPVPAEEGICVYSYYMPGGEEAFRKEMSAGGRK